MKLAYLATYIYNKKFYDSIRRSEKMQFEPVEVINKYRERKFQNLIDHCRKNVPYYRDKLNDVNSLEDIEKVDFLTKTLITENLDLLKAKNFPKERFVPNSTSGSTGTSFNFYSDKYNTYLQAIAIRGDSWAGIKYGQKVIHFWGA